MASSPYHIAIVGIGGRTGSMFGFELKDKAKILGIAKNKEKELVNQKKIFIERNHQSLVPLNVEIIKESDFSSFYLPEFILLTTKNPVEEIVEYYYQKIKSEERLPALVLSQNGKRAIEEARKALERVLGKREKEVEIIRVNLFNAIERKEKENKIIISYNLPIRISMGSLEKERQGERLSLIFKRAGMRVKKIPPEEIRNMEYSKLFLNLIGMSCASRNISLREGFLQKEVFKEEISALKEYIKVVRAKKGNFLNLFYPIKIFAFLIEKLPFSLLFPLRKSILKIIEKGRSKKEKGNLDEIDYYNGEVVKLARECKISAPVNEKILKRAKAILKKVGCQSG